MRKYFHVSTTSLLLFTTKFCCHTWFRITNDFCCINITYPPKNDESFLSNNKVKIISMANYLPTIVNILSHIIHNGSSKLPFEINNDHLCVSILWLPQCQLRVDIKTNKSNYGFILNNDSHEMVTWNNSYFANDYISTLEIWRISNFNIISKFMFRLTFYIQIILYLNLSTYIRNIIGTSLERPIFH